MSQISYKGIVTASLRDRSFRSRNEGKLQLFKLLAQFLCSSADNISSKFDSLPGYIGIRKIATQNEQKKITNLLYKDVIISAGLPTINTADQSASAKFSALIPYETLRANELHFVEADVVEYVLYTKSLKSLSSRDQDDECILATAPLDNPSKLLGVATTTQNNILIEWELIFSNKEE